MTSQLKKRPFSSLEQVGDWSQYPASTHADAKPFYLNPNPYGPFLTTDPFFDPFTSPISDEHPLAVGDVNIDNFHTLISSAFSFESLPAYHTIPLMSFQNDNSDDASGLPHNFVHPNDMLPDLYGGTAYQDSYLHNGLDSNATQHPSQTATVTPSLQPHLRHRKSRSITPLDARSLHGRSSGSEYVIDSPYEYAPGGVMTPGTAHSYEFVERPQDVDHNASGVLTHENDLMGLEISPSVQAVALDPRSTERYSRSPQGIHLDAVDSSGPPIFFGEWQSSNSDPWVPLPSHRIPTPNPGQLWDNDYTLFPSMNTFHFPPQQDAASQPRAHPSPQPSPNVNAMMRKISHNSQDSMSQTHVTSREPSHSPPVSQGPSKRRAAGRRTGPLDDSKKPGVKMTRRVHACWCCKMRKVTCNADTENSCPECLRFWQHKMTGPFSGKRLCIRTSLEDLQQLFIPDFMIEHLKSPTMKAFTKDLVGSNGWLNRGKTEVHLSCGFGPPLVVKGVQEFRPNGGPVQIFKWGQNNQSVEAIPTLPIGVSQISLEEEDDDFSGLGDLEQHLNQVIDSEDDLNEYAERVLRSCDYSRSSRTLKVVLKWYQEWKVKESMKPRAEGLLRNAIKVIMINTIFARRLILSYIPQQFEKFFNEAPYTSRHYSRHRQSPRLINRQVKAALWVLQQRLLSNVLKDFGRELTQADGWPTCFAVATILAFSLEQTQQKSIGFVRLNGACEGLDRKSVKSLGSDHAIHEYRTVALVRVFDMIHVIMRCKSEKQTLSDGRSTKRISTMGSNLRKVISDLKDDFNTAPEQDQQRLSLGEEPCRLVSALLELIQ